MTDQEQTRPTDDFGGFICVVIAAVGLVVIVAAFVGKAMDASRGSYADWLAAIATVAAFGAASIAGWLAHRALRVEQERDRWRDEQTQRAQAELVGGWTERTLYGLMQENLAKADSNMRVNQVDLKIRNGSHLPVSDVVIQVYHYVLDGPIAYQVCQVSIPTVRPNDEVVHNATGQQIAPSMWPLDREKGTQVVILFTDAGGRRWKRTASGSLRVIGQRPEW